MTQVLLDTNILLGLFRSERWALEAVDTSGLNKAANRAVSSVVCHGELLALAERNDWGETRRAKLEVLLRAQPVIGIHFRPILDAYARIDAWTRGKTGTAPGDASPPQPARPLAQNDLWIAATAHATGSALLSADTDFAHLHGIWFEHLPVVPR